MAIALDCCRLFEGISSDFDLTGEGEQQRLYDVARTHSAHCCSFRRWLSLAPSGEWLCVYLFLCLFSSLLSATLHSDSSGDLLTANRLDEESIRVYLFIRQNHFYRFANYRLTGRLNQICIWIIWHVVRRTSTDCRIILHNRETRVRICVFSIKSFSIFSHFPSYGIH